MGRWSHGKNWSLFLLEPRFDWTYKPPNCDYFHCWFLLYLKTTLNVHLSKHKQIKCRFFGLKNFHGSWWTSKAKGRRSVASSPWRTTKRDAPPMWDSPKIIPRFPMVSGKPMVKWLMMIKIVVTSVMNAGFTPCHSHHPQVITVFMGGNN